MAGELLPIAIGFQVLGGGLSVFAQDAQDDALTASLQLSATIDELNADRIDRATAEEEARVRKQGKSFISAQEALVGGSGVTVESFAPVLNETQKNAELDALAVRVRGENQSLALRRSARSKKLEISSIKGSSGMRKLSGLLNLGSGITKTILSSPESANAFQASLNKKEE